MGKIIGCATHKGGNGKSVTSISLAAGLAREGNSCLLIDLDAQAHSGMGLGIELEYNDLNIADCLSSGNVNIQDIIVQTSVENLHLVPSNIRLSATAENLYTKIHKEERLSAALEPIKGSYDYIVVDNPPTLGTLLWNTIHAADSLIIPCSMGARSADGLNDLLAVIDEVKRGFENYWILLTMVDRRNKATNRAVETTLKNFKKKILKSEIPRQEAINQAQMVGEDIFTYAPRSRVAHAYKELVKEVKRKCRRK